MTAIDYKKLARLSYKLMTSTDIQYLGFVRLVKQFEESRIVACKYFYELYIHMKLDDEGFAYSSHRFNFLGGEPPQLAELLNVYWGKYRYFFLPIIIDYGLSNGYVHQGAVLFNLINGMVLIYEPYGTYCKYEKTYEAPIVECLKKILPSKFEKFSTWHKHWALPTGIQTILINKNNSNYGVFKKHFEELYAKLDRPHLNPPESIIKYDKTFESIMLLDYVVKNNISAHKDEALELYMRYNSKTCVSITIAEFWFIFTLVKKDSLDRDNIDKFYQNFLENGNIFLYDSLYRATIVN